MPLLVAVSSVEVDGATVAATAIGGADVEAIGGGGATVMGGGGGPRLPTMKAAAPLAAKKANTRCFQNMLNVQLIYHGFTHQT